MSAVNCKTEDVKSRGNVVLLAVEILVKQKGYRDVKTLGQGTFGDVRLMYDPERESAIAVKIVTSEYISKSEMVLWPELSHPNVVPLLELITLRGLDAAIFVMPVQKTVLGEALCEEEFSKSPGALDTVKKWLRQILCGLEYLHAGNFCHLDLKADNVLLSETSVAMICDFTFLNGTTRPLKRHELGLPYIFRPPEVCPTVGPGVSVDGNAYDMWSYGVMALEICTHFWMAANLREYNSWIKDIYPTMFELLQVDTFYFLMYETFPGVQLKKLNCEEALNFIRGFLKVDCRRRASALEATRHPFLKNGTAIAPPPDAIWIRKIQSDNESCAKFTEKCRKNCLLKYGCKKEIGQVWVDESNADCFKGYTENDIALEKVEEQKMPNTPRAKKLNLHEMSFNDSALENDVATPQKKNLRQRLGDFDEILDTMQQLMVSMNHSALNSKNADSHYAVRKEDTETDSIQKAHPTVFDVAAGGERCLPEFVVKEEVYDSFSHSDDQTGPEAASEEESKPDIGSPLPQGSVFEALDENKNEVIDTGSGKNVGRRRRVMQWMRNKYLALERVIKRRPYKLLKEQL